MTNQGVYSNPLVPAYLFPRGENFAIYKKFERYNPGTKLMEQFWSADMEGGDPAHAESLLDRLPQPA